MVAEISSSLRASIPTTESGSSPAREGSSIARSRPAEKLCPSPRRRTTRTSSDTSAPIAASARHMRGVCALRTSGRDRVTVATAPLTS